MPATLCVDIPWFRVGSLHTRGIMPRTVKRSAPGCLGLLIRFDGGRGDAEGRFIY